MKCGNGVGCGKKLAVRCEPTTVGAGINPIGHFKNLNPSYHILTTFQQLIGLLVKGVREDLRAEGEHVVTCRVTVKRAPTGIAPLDRTAWVYFDRLLPVRAILPPLLVHPSGEKNMKCLQALFRNHLYISTNLVFSDESLSPSKLCRRRAQGNCFEEKEKKKSSGD